MIYFGIKLIFFTGIYGRTFIWIITKINQAIYSPPGKEKRLSIGVFDIFGFESFEVNSFEQLCINYANEMLQQLFIQLVLKQQQEEYIREEIQWVEVSYHNNEPICNLVEGRGGMLTLLEDAAGGGLGKATDQNLLEALDDRFRHGFLI